jgi:hypothetical protein
MAARRLEQSADERQHWLFVSLGIREPAPAPIGDPDGVPFHQPPGWLLPYLRRRAVENDDGCPF